MGKIIAFKPHKETSFYEGDAICLECKREWIAVIKIGTWQLECPSCSTFKGVYKYPFNFKEGTLVRQCNCGCEYFLISTEGHLCAKCGAYQEY